jgi:septum formation protein
MLLERAGIRFRTVVSRCDEEAITHPHPQVLALERARAKAHAAELGAGDAGAMVLGADTVVALGTTVFGKPADRADALRILGALQGTTHSVFTGHCCVMVGADGRMAGEAARIAVARITMRPLTAEEIRAYVESGESDGRAGAYAIQESGDRFVVDLQGGWDTVVGLNVAMVVRLHQELTERLPDGWRP